MTSQHQRELIIGIVFLMLGFLLCVPIVISQEKEAERKATINKKVNELILKDWKFKRDRLVIYTDIIYRNE